MSIEASVEYFIAAWRRVNERLPRFGPQKWPERETSTRLTAMPLLVAWGVLANNAA